MFKVATFKDQSRRDMFFVSDPNGREVKNTLTANEIHAFDMCEEMNIRYGYIKPQRDNYNGYRSHPTMANPHLMDDGYQDNVKIVERQAPRQNVNHGFNPMVSFETMNQPQQYAHVEQTNNLPKEYISLDGNTTDDDFNGSNPRYTKYIGEEISVSPMYKFDGKLALTKGKNIITIFRKGNLEEMMRYDNHKVFIDEAVKMMEKEEQHVASRNFTINNIKEIETDSLNSCLSLMSAIASRDETPFTAVAAKCTWSSSLPFHVKEEDVSEEIHIFDNTLKGSVAALKKFSKLHKNTAAGYIGQFTNYINQCFEHRMADCGLQVGNIVEDYEELLEVISKEDLDELNAIIEKDNMKEALRLKFETIDTVLNNKESTYILPVEQHASTVVYFSDLKIPKTTGVLTNVYEKELSSIVAATMVEVSEMAIGSTIIFACHEGWFSVYNPHTSDPSEMYFYVNHVHSYIS